jgi:trehalose/maltose hydrolase-like predicted phosphorylase
MRHKHLAAIFTALLLTFSATAALAASGDDDNRDTDTRLVNAKVVEVTDEHLSVMAQTGVEHVIAINRADTKVTIEGRVVSLKDVREGDVITIDLDAQKRVKFAKSIAIRTSEGSEVARNRR